MTESRENNRGQIPIVSNIRENWDLTRVFRSGSGLLEASLSGDCLKLNHSDPFSSLFGCTIFNPSVPFC
jgi:hypothetical protein